MKTKLQSMEDGHQEIVKINFFFKKLKNYGPEIKDKSQQIKSFYINNVSNEFRLSKK